MRAALTQEAVLVSGEGIWTGEIYGPYGWENCGVYIIERGLMLGGNDRHYSAGRYRLTGKDFEANVFSHFHGRPRTLFGEHQKEFEFVLSGEMADGVIEGEMRSPNRPRSGIRCRFTKRANLPRSEPLEIAEQRVSRSSG